MASAGPHLTEEYLLDIQSPHNSYFNFNLHHLRAYNNIGLEANLGTRAFLKQEFAILDATTRDDVNAHFETITYSFTGEPARLDMAIQHLRDWLEYHATWNEGHINSTLCGNGLTCIPEDQVTTTEQTPLGPVESVHAGTSTKQRSATPLPVGVRPGSDFLWQRSPYRLDGGQNATGEAASVDFLLPYYMLRHFTEVAEPANEPLPAWNGPTTR